MTVAAGNSVKKSNPNRLLDRITVLSRGKDCWTESQFCPGEKLEAWTVERYVYGRVARIVVPEVSGGERCLQSCKVRVLQPHL